LFRSMGGLGKFAAITRPSERASLHYPVPPSWRSSSQKTGLPAPSVTPFHAAWICFTTGSGIGT
jgi:hypothetical protein